MREKAWRMLGTYYGMWSGELGLIYATEHIIVLKPGVRPAHKMRCTPGPEMREVTQRDVQGQLQAG